MVDTTSIIFFELVIQFKPVLKKRKAGTEKRKAGTEKRTAGRY